MTFAPDEIALIMEPLAPTRVSYPARRGLGGPRTLNGAEGLSQAPTLSSCGTESRAHLSVTMVWGAAAPSLGPAWDMEGGPECCCWFLCSW